jgi:hypothetical protein
MPLCAPLARADLDHGATPISAMPTNLARALTVMALFVLLAAPLRALPGRLYGEEPHEEPGLELSDDWPHSFVPNLIDLPSTDLVERHRPVLELGYASRRFGGPSFTDAVRVAQDGFRLAFHVRAFRDLQISALFPFYSTEVDVRGPDPDIDGSVNAFSLELKYLSPYEIAGVRTSAGVRFGVRDDDAVFFHPDDFQRQSAFYLTFSKTPRANFRLHLTLMTVMGDGTENAPVADHDLVAFALEHDFIRARENFLRGIVEVVKPSTEGPRHGFYGINVRRDEAYVNLALRVRSGIVQVDAGTRRATQQGFDEHFVTLVKRF